MADEDVTAPHKTKEEMRYEPHEYVDANHNADWCAVCGRGELWRAHPVKKIEKVEQKVPSVQPGTTAETLTVPAAAAVVTTVEPDEDESAFTTGSLDSDAE